MNKISTVLLYTFVLVFSIFIGDVVAMIRKPHGGFRSIFVKKGIVALLVLGFLFFIGALFSVRFLSGLSPVWLEFLLSFGIAALLFLATAASLTKGHEEKKALLQTGIFFVVFLIFLLIAMIA